MALQPVALTEVLSSEVVRKLRLASEAETKEDREIICEEVFCDVTSRLDETAVAQLGAPERVPFYVVLARYYATPKGADSAVVVLHLLQSLYGQGYAAPLVALLLHRWLLMRRAPSRGLPEEQRTRVANALSLGSAQVFMGDVHGGAFAFEPLWRCLCHEVILGEQSPPWRSECTVGLPAPPTPSSSLLSKPTNGLVSLSLIARTALLAITAAFLTYYTSTDNLEYVLCCFPSPTAPPTPSVSQSGTATSPPSDNTAAASDKLTSSRAATAVAAGARVHVFSSGSHVPRSQPLASPPYHGVDFIMMEVVDVLGKISTEAGLVSYLKALQRLRGQPALTHRDGMRLGTRLKLQSVLTAMAAPGGPRYYPYSVGIQALEALDALFPQGINSRRLVRAIFRLLHPADWIGDVLAVPLRMVRAFLSCVLFAAFRWLHAVVLWGGQGGVPRAQIPVARMAAADSGVLPPARALSLHSAPYRAVNTEPEAAYPMQQNSVRRHVSPQLRATLTPRRSADVRSVAAKDFVVVRAGEDAGPLLSQVPEALKDAAGAWVVPGPVHAADVLSLLDAPRVEHATHDQPHTVTTQTLPAEQ